MRRFGNALGALALGLLASGCGGDEPDRYTLEGSITFDGKPIPAGTVTFLPSGDRGNSGPAGNAKIVDGRYSTANGGKGVVGGPHRVVVNGFDGQADPSAELPYGKPLFLDYEIQYELPKYESGKEAETIDFKVPKEASQPKRQQAPTA